MIREELQHDFHNEQGISWINSQGEPDIDYVMWLEDKILATKNLPLPPAEGADCFYYDKPGKEKITPAQQQPTAEGGNLNLDDINYSDLPIPKPSLYPAEGAKTCWGCGEELHYLPNGLPPYRCECGAVNPAETMEAQPQPTAEGAEHKPEIKMPTDGWVDINTKMPDSGFCILLFSKSGGVAEGAWIGSKGYFEQWRWNSILNDVTHWMPLPNPPIK